MTAALKKVFKKPSFIGVAFFVAVIVFVGALYFQNLQLISNVISSGAVGIGHKAQLLASLIGGIASNNTLLSSSVLLSISVLFGVNVAMLIFMIRRNRAAHSTGKNTGSTIGGAFAGMLGIGCSACGSLILTPLLAFFGASGMIAFLPLGGTEFGILGALLLFFSIWKLSQKINDPLVCPVE